MIDKFGDWFDTYGGATLGCIVVAIIIFVVWTLYTSRADIAFNLNYLDAARWDGPITKRDLGLACLFMWWVIPSGCKCSK